MTRSLFVRKAQGALALLGAGVLAAPVAVQAQEEAPAINNGNVSFTVGADVFTDYWFRGIPQENQGLILQPYADVSVSLISNDDFTLDVYTGIWNSLHWGDSQSSTGGNAGNDNVWYEADWFAGATVGFGSFAVDFGYTWLYSPAGGVEFAEEIYAGLSYDDSELWGDGFDGLQPYVTIVFEIDGGSDSPLAGTAEKGIYYEVGIGPSFDLTDSLDAPVTLSLPVAVGFGKDDYYQYVNSAGAADDDTFGFIQVGVVLSMPIEAIPAEYGAWEVAVGGYYIALGDANEAIGNGANFGTNGGDDDSFFGSIGISMSY